MESAFRLAPTPALATDAEISGLYRLIENPPKFLCTCGWSLDVVADLDAARSHVQCGACGGVAVRTTLAPK